MSQSNYFKNFILCGDMDFFCLLCTESFKLPQEVSKHIRWENHRKLLKGLAYFPKFCKDRIYKVENQFYCEVCNLVLQSFDAVAKHIRSETHNIDKCNAQSENRTKSNQKNNGHPSKIEVKEECNGGAIVIANTLVLKKQEWHGVVSNHCYLCDVAVNNFEKHVSSNRHIINHISAKIILEDGKYYRKINEETLHCFKCKKSFSAESIKEHWQREGHSMKPDVGHETLKSFIIDKNNNIATCRHCRLVFRYHFETLMSHFETHSKGEKKETLAEVYDRGDRGKLRAELKQYGKEYCIKLDCGGRKGFCSLCEVFIVPHINNFKEHAKGFRHQGFMEHKGLVKKTGKKTEKPRYKTKPWSQYVRSFIRLNDTNICMINNEIFISILSYVPVSLILPDKWKCFVCDVTIPKLNLLKEHLAEHKTRAQSIPTITNIKGEIIREVQPNIYHCGYCNTVYPGSSVLEKHLMSFKHKLAKEQTSQELTDSIIGEIPRYRDLSMNMNSVDILD